MKSSSMVTDLYWSLPGPRRFISRIAEHAKRSRIMFINLPLEPLPGTWEGVKKGLADAHIGNVVNLIIRDGTDIASDIGVHFSRRRVIAGELVAICASQRTAVLLLPKDDVARRNCDQYANEFMNAINPRDVEANIHLVVGINEEAFTKDEHKGGIQVVVFDEGLAPDEMEAYVALRMLDRPGPGSTRLARSIVSEFAGFDVEFAEQLMTLDESKLINITASLPALMGRTNQMGERILAA